MNEITIKINKMVFKCICGLKRTMKKYVKNDWELKEGEKNPFPNEKPRFLSYCICGKVFELKP